VGFTGSSKKNKSSLLTFTKGALKTLPGKYHAPEQPSMEAVMSSPIEEFNDTHDAYPVESASTPQARPSATELLQLAGLDTHAADALADFEDEATVNNASASTNGSPQLAFVFPLSLVQFAKLPLSLPFPRHNLFPAQSSTPVAEPPNKTWARATIFGPLCVNFLQGLSIAL
jgi:hypothetical protein